MARLTYWIYKVEDGNYSLSEYKMVGSARQVVLTPSEYNRLCTWHDTPGVQRWLQDRYED